MAKRRNVVRTYRTAMKVYQLIKSPLKLKIMLILACVMLLVFAVGGILVSILGASGAIIAQPLKADDKDVPLQLIQVGGDAAATVLAPYTDHQKQLIKDSGVDLSSGLVSAISLFTNLTPDEIVQLLPPYSYKFEKMTKTTTTTVTRTTPATSSSTNNNSSTSSSTSSQTTSSGNSSTASSSSSSPSPSASPGATSQPKTTTTTTTTTEQIEVLTEAHTYNGTHIFKYENKETSTTSGPSTNADGSTVSTTTVVSEPKLKGQDWDQDYKLFHEFLGAHGFTNTEDWFFIYRQAMAFDPDFFDPEADPLLLDLIGDGRKGTNMMPLPPEEITELLKTAIGLNGMDEESWLAPMQQLVMRESGGNPNAENPTMVFYSAKWGYQNAKGLCQMMAPTFYANMISGYENIWDPLDNAAAAIHYIIGRYGHVSNIPNLYSDDYKGY